MTRIDSSHDCVRIKTRDGNIAARRVVIATGYATSYFRPLAGRFRMYRTYVVGTEPMNAYRERVELGLSDVMVWDTERPYHYARWTHDHRLLLGGADRRLRLGQRRDIQLSLADCPSVWPLMDRRTSNYDLFLRPPLGFLLLCFLGTLAPFFRRFAQADRDRLLAALHLPARPTL